MAHKCTAASAATIASQLGRFTYTHSVPELPSGMIPQKAIVTLPNKQQAEIVYWRSFSGTSLVLKCPYTGELFHFRGQMTGLPKWSDFPNTDCAVCKHYAWHGTMHVPAQAIDGSWHHPACARVNPERAVRIGRAERHAVSALALRPFARGAASIGGTRMIGANAPDPADAQAIQAIISGDPTGQAQQAWNSVVSQVQAEGGSMYNAASTFVEQYNGLVSRSFGLPASTAAQAASQYVIAGQTIAGAVATVDSIAQASQSQNYGGAIEQASNLFTGGLIAVFVATGVTTAGIGAAITAAAALAINIGVQALEGAGLIQTPPQGAQICGSNPVDGLWMNPPPPYAINCVAPVCQRGQEQSAPCTNQPGPYWRHFPDPNNSADAAWFTPGTKNFSWGGLTWVCPGQGAIRPIDYAFPQYRQLECELSRIYELPGISHQDIGIDQAGALYYFLSGYFQAWKLNAEYFLNGLKGARDEQVLEQYQMFWNRARQPGPGFDFQPTQYAPIDSTNMALGDCSQVTDTYVSMLVNKTNMTTLHVNTGPKVQQKLDPGIIKGIHIWVPGAKSTSMSTTKKVALYGGGTLAAAGLAAAAYGLFYEGAVGYVFGKVFDKVVGFVKEHTRGWPMPTLPSSLSSLRAAEESPKRRGSKRSRWATQTLIFSKSRFTKRQAKAWAKRNGYKYGKVDVKENTYRLRQEDPKKFRTMRTITLSSGVKAVRGKR